MGVDVLHPHMVCDFTGLFFPRSDLHPPNVEHAPVVIGEPITGPSASIDAENSDSFVGSVVESHRKALQSLENPG